MERISETGHRQIVGQRSCAVELQTRPSVGEPDEGRGILGEVISLHDIHDVEGFVNKTLDDARRLAQRGGRAGKAGINFADDERDDLVLEGIAILFELDRKYEPRRGDHKQDGRFSGFAAFFLPKRLSDAWHRMHPEHRYITGEDGKRKWIYCKPSVSLDAVLQNRDAGSSVERRRDRAEAALLGPTKWVPVTVP